MAHMGTISSKGQLVIPAELRKKYRLKSGAKVIFGEHEGKLTVESSVLDQVLALRGCLAGAGQDLEAMLMEERYTDRQRDERKFANVQ